MWGCGVSSNVHYSARTFRQTASATAVSAEGRELCLESPRHPQNDTRGTTQHTGFGARPKWTCTVCPARAVDFHHEVWERLGTTTRVSPGSNSMNKLSPVTNYG